MYIKQEITTSGQKDRRSRSTSQLESTEIKRKHISTEEQEESNSRSVQSPQHNIQQSQRKRKRTPLIEPEVLSNTQSLIPRQEPPPEPTIDTTSIPGVEQTQDPLTDIPTVTFSDATTTFEAPLLTLVTHISTITDISTTVTQTQISLSSIITSDINLNLGPLNTDSRLPNSSKSKPTVTNLPPRPTSGNDSSTKSEEKGMNTTLIFVLIIVLVLGLAFAGLSVYLYMRSKKRKQRKEKQKELSREKGLLLRPDSSKSNRDGNVTTGGGNSDPHLSSSNIGIAISGPESPGMMSLIRPDSKQSTRSQNRLSLKPINVKVERVNVEVTPTATNRQSALLPTPIVTKPKNTYPRFPTTPTRIPDIIRPPSSNYSTSLKDGEGSNFSTNVNAPLSRQASSVFGLQFNQTYNLNGQGEYLTLQNASNEPIKTPTPSIDERMIFNSPTLSPPGTAIVFPKPRSRQLSTNTHASSKSTDSHSRSRSFMSMESAIDPDLNYSSGGFRISTFQTDGSSRSMSTTSDGLKKPVPPVPGINNAYWEDYDIDSSPGNSTGRSRSDAETLTSPLGGNNGNLGDWDDALVDVELERRNQPMAF